MHLGIYRNSKCTPNIEEKISLGCRIAYSLLGAGFHGKSGLKQSFKVDMWRKYAIPRLIYGLEVHKLRKKDIQQLEHCTPHTRAVHAATCLEREVAGREN